MTLRKREGIAAAGKWICAMCKDQLPASFHIDHVIPLGDGGEDSEGTGARNGAVTRRPARPYDDDKRGAGMHR